MTDKVDKKKLNVFKITGKFKRGRQYQQFTKELLVENKQKAQELIFSFLGSNHRVKRRGIKIEKIERISAEDITNPIIKQQIGGK